MPRDSSPKRSKLTNRRQPKRRVPVLGVVVIVVFAAFTVLRAIGSMSSAGRPSESVIVPSAKASARPASVGPRAPLPGAPFSLDRARAAVTARGLRVAEERAFVLGSAPTPVLLVHRGETRELIITLGTFRASKDPAVRLGVTTQHAYSLELQGPEAASLGPKVEVALKLRTLGSLDDVNRLVREFDFTLDQRIVPTSEYTFGSRNYVVRGAKGPNKIELFVLDFAAAARGEDHTALRLGNDSVAFIYGAYSDPETVNALLDDIAAP